MPSRQQTSGNSKQRLSGEGAQLCQIVAACPLLEVLKCIE